MRLLTDDEIMMFVMLLTKDERFTSEVMLLTNDETMAFVMLLTNDETRCY